MQLYRMQWKYHMHIHTWLIITNCLVLSLFQVHAICVVQRSSFNVTSESGHPVTTLVPVSVHSAVHSAVHRTVHSTVHRIESRNFFKVNFKPTDNDSVNTCSITTEKKRIKIRIKNTMSCLYPATPTKDGQRLSLKLHVDIPISFYPCLRHLGYLTVVFPSF